MWKRIKGPSGAFDSFLTNLNKFFPHFFQVSSFPHFLFIPQNFYKFFPSKFFCDNTLPHSFFSLRCYVKQTFINVGRYLLSYFFQIWYSGSGCVIELLKKLGERKKLQMKLPWFSCRTLSVIDLFFQLYVHEKHFHKMKNIKFTHCVYRLILI